MWASVLPLGGELVMVLELVKENESEFLAAIERCAEWPLHGLQRGCALVCGSRLGMALQ
ncbi:MAG: hypothetical protein JXA21_08810 [Anaerolineae bacterium]|nr:hypothetical protein [Anaerolineae bacterium]